MTTEFGVLGPLVAVRDGVAVDLGGPRQRAVLARLLVAGGRAVPLDALVDDVWEVVPDTAAKTVQKYVSQLRAALGATTVRTAGHGYAVELDDAAVDSRTFERLLADGDAEAALALWRGEALDGVPDLPFVTAERARLTELRGAAEELRLQRLLDAGRHGEVVPEAARLFAACPARERLCGLLMLALYRCGRQVEALEVFRRHREGLDTGLGLQPAADLVALQAAILRQDAELAAPSPTAEGNLPRPLSSFVGRERDVPRVVAALRDHRVVTLTGPGGVGKTRLATEAAAAGGYPAGAWFVDLAALAEPDLVPHAVATALALGDRPDRDDEETVLAALRHRDGLLLVLDNCEHLVEPSASLADRIARGCPAVRVLATSRRPLGVDGECVLPVAPLCDDAARRLFVDRARLAGTPEEETAADTVADVCRAFDGLPLALELAAGQLRSLGPEALAAHLDERLRFASRRFDTPPRQRTLQDMVDWSCALLPPATQRFFVRLGVFAATFSLEAAAEVCDEGDPLPHVTTLVEHSLVVRDAGAPGRYRLLDTLRLFALEHLDRTGEGGRVRRRHASFYLALGRAGGPHLHGPDERAWAARLEAEEPNLHAALGWARDHDPELALRLGLALWPFWEVRWRERFAVDYFSAGLPRADADGDLRAWVLTAMADLASNQGEALRSGGWAQQAAEHFRRTGDRRGLAKALLALASARGNAGALDEADRAVTEALILTRDLGDATLAGHGLNFASFVATRRGDHRTAERLSRQEVQTWRAAGSRIGEATALRHVAVALRYLGRFDEAAALCEQALAVWSELGDTPSIAHVQLTLADIARLRGDDEAALRGYETALGEFGRIGDRRCTASTYKNVALIAAARGDHARALPLFRDAVRLRLELGDQSGLAECFEGLAGSLAATGRTAEARALLDAADERRRASGAAPSAEDERARAQVQALVDGVPPSFAPPEAVGFVLALDSGR
jgi:predicted ATPase/DNA-binding SARP family transcriptional activator